MWKCQKCGEEIEDTFDACWNCGTGRDGAPPQTPSELDEVKGEVPSQTVRRERVRSGDVTTVVMSRYRDGYLVARVTTGIGQTVKLIGIGLAVIIFLWALFAATQGGDLKWGLAGMLLAVIVGVPFYVLGILVSAHGQVLKASLDTSVHTSPFLKKEQMAKIMSLQCDRTGR